MSGRDRYVARPKKSGHGAWEVRDQFTGKMYSYHRGIGCGDMAVKIAEDMNNKERRTRELPREIKP